MSKRHSILLISMTMLCLTLAACGNGDDGPMAVAKELFQRLENHGFTEKITELVCAASRDDVAELFGLGELLDMASDSGVDPQQIADVFMFEPGLTFQEVDAGSDDATVHVRGRLKITVDAAKFKTLARQILEDQGAPDEERTDNALDQLYVDFARDVEQELGGPVDVDLGLIKEDGKWLVCHWGPPDRSSPTSTPSRQVNLDETFTLHSDEAVVIAGTGLILRLEVAGHEFSADHSDESVFAELTATLNGTSQRLYVDLEQVTQSTVGDYTVYVLGIDGFGRGSCELRVMPTIAPSPFSISATSTTFAPTSTAPATPTEPMPITTPSPFPISATPTLTQPTAASSAADWQTHSRQGFELECPGDWAFAGPDGIECAALYHFYPSSLKLISFSACWEDAVGGNLLTLAETFARFREAFEDALISSKMINGIQVDVIQYKSSKSNGIYALTASQGTVALWQRENIGWALVDEENQYQENGIFDRILASFKFHEDP